MWRIRILLCKMGIHKYETIAWSSKMHKSSSGSKVGPLNRRFVRCKICNKNDVFADKRAAMMKSLIQQRISERRVVIVEKHKNPKLYQMRVKDRNFEVITIFEKEVLDEHIFRYAQSLRLLCREHGFDERCIEIVCLDDPNSIFRETAEEEEPDMYF